MRKLILLLALLLPLMAYAGVKTAGVGHFQIPTAPAAGTSVTSGAANVYTTNAVQLIASTSSAILITGIYAEEAAVSAATYKSVQLMIGAGGSETVIGQYLISPSTGSTVTRTYRPIFPPIPVANATRIAVKTADSAGSLATLISLEVIATTNVVDDGIAVGTVTTVTNQLTAAQVATGVWQDATSGDFTTASSIGKSLYIANVAPGGSGGLMISGTNAGTTTLGALTITGATTHTGNVVLSDGLTISAPSTGNRAGLDIAGNGTGAALKLVAGATGVGMSVAGGGTSGDGIKVTTTSGHGINLAPVGTSMHGLLATGGNGGTSDGIKAVAGTGGVDLRAAITGNVTGNVSGSVGSVTGAVGSVTGLTASNLDATVSSRMATYTQPTGFLAATFPSGTIANTTNITAGTIATVTTVTNQLTAAAIATGVWTDTTAGDFTTSASIGKSVMNGVALGTGLTVNDLTTKTGFSLAASQHVIVDSGTVTTLTNLPSIPANWLTATGINAGALNGKGDWLLSSSYTAPTNLTAAQIATGVWQDTTAGDFTTALSVGKSVMNGVTLGTGLTIASVSGAVGSVTGLTASNLDAAVSSRMATYTQPTGFLAATFPGTVASPTNITAGTITTATSVTNRVSANVDQVDGAALTAHAAGKMPADVLTVAGTTQTARDLGGQLDAAVTTRMATYTQPTGFLAATFPGTVASTTNITAASGVALTSAYDPAKTDAWTVALPGSYGAGTAGYIVGNAYSGGDTAGTTTLLSRLSATRAGNLDNLDAAISTRSTYAGADTSGTTTLLSRLSAGRATGLDNLDAAVTTRMATFTLPTNFSLFTISGGGAVTAGTVSDKTGYALTSAYDAAKTAAQAGDSMGLSGGAITSIWSVAVPGAYASGTPAYLIGNRLDAAVSSRLATSGYAAPDNSGITAIKAKTDSLTFSVAGKVDANAKAVNGVALTGTGTDIDPWGPVP